MNGLIFYNPCKIYLQFPRFPDYVAILVKSKMAAILAAILDDVTHHQSAISHIKYLPYLVDHMTGYLLEVKYFPNIVTPQRPSGGVTTTPSLTRTLTPPRPPFPHPYQVYKFAYTSEG